MNVIVILLPLALLLAFTFVAAFVWAAGRGQYDDLDTPAHKMLLDESIANERTSK